MPHIYVVANITMCDSTSDISLSFFTEACGTLLLEKKIPLADLGAGESGAYDPSLGPVYFNMKLLIHVWCPLSDPSLGSTLDLPLKIPIK